VSGEDFWSRAWTYSKALVLVTLWALWILSTVGASLMLLYVGLMTLSRSMALVVAVWPLLVHLTLWPTFSIRTQMFLFSVGKKRSR